MVFVPRGFGEVFVFILWFQSGFSMFFMSGFFLNMFFLFLECFPSAILLTTLWAHIGPPFRTRRSSGGVVPT